MNYFDSVFVSLLNDIYIDIDISKRVYGNKLRYSPIKSIKTYSLFEKLRFSKFVYLFLNLIWVVIMPFFAFFRASTVFLKCMRSKREISIINSRDVVLVANARTKFLYDKNIFKEKSFYLYLGNLADKEDAGSDNASIYSFVKYFDVIRSFFYTIFFMPYFLYKNGGFVNLLYLYCAFDLFVASSALKRLARNKNICSFYSSNHYDRWATLFDSLLINKKICMMQHGVVLDIDLYQKLKNVSTLYCIDEKSFFVFRESILNCSPAVFYQDVSMTLSKIDSIKKSILIIGQPHTIDQELYMCSKLKGKYDVYIKPHPLFGTKKYCSADGVFVIDKKDFFPKVDLALCYESTLGIEYEASGVHVIWWKGMSLEKIPDLVCFYLGK